jgi:hypothetical protein
MSLQDWIHDRSRDLAYWRASRKFKGRLGEIEVLERQAEEARGRPVDPPREPDLPGFYMEFNRDEVLPDAWVCASGREFAWSFNVQGCLNRLGGWIRDYRDPETGESAALSISTAAYVHGVNPRLLVASLQREKGLIRTKKAPPQKDLDWAAGVGAYDSAPWDKRFKGFGTQIRAMARTYRNRFDEWEPGKTIRVNFVPRRTARPWNAGTWSLLRYTPHDSASLLTWKILRFFFSQ